ncbi:MAG TPA: hypothetical protein VHP37_19870 [Burkholderiales bacterium]|nr:hypothetical protein [Burkholderiales bacterium]
MARTDTERYDQALAYIRTHVSDALANDILLKTGGQKAKYGGLLSLAWYGFDKVGTKSQHMALRGLLLCQNAYLDIKKYEYPVKDKTATNMLGKKCKNTIEYFKNKAETDIREAIRSYTRLPDVSLGQFAQTARDIKDMAGDFQLRSITRAETGNWGGTTNCYGAVKIWLFKSGLCSLQWMLTEGEQLNAYTCNQIIGDGDVVADDDIDDIPEGMVFNIHDSVTPAICHWGVSLGGGYAAASNTTAGGMSRNGPIFVDFQSGNSSYGIFKLKSSVDVCRTIYKSGEVYLKITDPLKSKAYY